MEGKAVTEYRSIWILGDTSYAQREGVFANGVQALRKMDYIPNTDHLPWYHQC